jgi:hypothetical protein
VTRDRRAAALAIAPLEGDSGRRVGGKVQGGCRENVEWLRETGGAESSGDAAPIFWKITPPPQYVSGAGPFALIGLASGERTTLP